ncbi:nitrate reductase associated protein [Acaryochloris sp. IP29b_bin.148]|uniref:nitrate reductase associated protein n=1 Tax=Acaryochloris sp. IP29b_bin.148 TaxID=2969218 RepID=UPI002623A5C0|nr:nitrate reductase associated protein [Acaryochloris sp. IP29b_bin.148]
MSTSTNHPADDILFFDFEEEFVEDLRCIPMIVRFKLDTCGIKLKLAEWNQFSEEEREQFTFQPCTSEDEIEDYREFLKDLIFMYTETDAAEIPVEEHPPWLDTAVIPPALVEKAQTHEVEISLQQWQGLSPLQRFALIKLSRPSHENKNFLPALQEFQLL